ncbi:hypothetical protein AVEN_6308-1 [Araneus ventricosus]|uniref:Uncharacterized protein n=1 Tax=Araneus ventricosus TaxID=182803 RepID=A0A4Y2W6P0_ARAVE|nr:hypothetical protein AVEN_6308-1 [Araneus ventricosus]
MQWSEFVSLWEGRTPKESKGLFRRQSRKQLPTQMDLVNLSLYHLPSAPASVKRFNQEEPRVPISRRRRLKIKAGERPTSPIHRSDEPQKHSTILFIDKDNNEKEVKILSEMMTFAKTVAFLTTVGENKYILSATYTCYTMMINDSNWPG